MREEQIIEEILHTLGEKTSSVKLGIGDDDTALLRWGKREILFTCDCLVERIHFSLDYFTLRDIGWKAMAVNVSDIFAMGGNPRYALVSMGIPKGLIEKIGEIYEGIKEFSLNFKVEVVGGNLSLSPFLWVDVSMLGEVKRIIRRDGARPQDKIILTGPVGEARAGREILEKRLKGYPTLVKKFLRPYPRREVLQWMDKGITFNSGIDISDGLGKDLYRILKASGVGAFIYPEKIPFSKELLEFAGEKKAFSYAWGGGEDYEMILTLTSLEWERLRSLTPSPPFSCIGEIVEGKPCIDSPQGLLSPNGFDHFSYEERNNQ